MLRAWFWGKSLALIGSFLIPIPQGYTSTGALPPQPALIAGQAQPAVPAEGIPQASLTLPVRSHNAAEVDVVHEVAVGLPEPRMEPQRALPVRPAEPAAVQVVEPSRRVTLEELRRSLYLYPDHDLLSRFLESGTERQPLFSDDA